VNILKTKFKTKTKIDPKLKKDVYGLKVETETKIKPKTKETLFRTVHVCNTTVMSSCVDELLQVLTTAN
jgi:hypothetical protein